ncbi:hypothetical protein HanIR_Chr01g0040561 [Helianthus annuus]|nr:hypothetical protein HanIR_Chr01g0040561 [Helianthus annuus]
MFSMHGSSFSNLSSASTPTCILTTTDFTGGVAGASNSGWKLMNSGSQLTSLSSTQIFRLWPFHFKFISDETRAPVRTTIANLFSEMFLSWNEASDCLANLPHRSPILLKTCLSQRHGGTPVILTQAILSNSGRVPSQRYNLENQLHQDSGCSEWNLSAST